MLNDIKKHLGNRTVEVYDVIDSTNTRAKQLAALGAESGTVVIAKTQSNGYGQKNRSFYCEEGAGLYMSIILRPQSFAEDSIKLTACAAVAAAQSIESLVSCDVKIKWVNDLYLNGRKVCGILTEGSADPATGLLRYAVIGIGINTAEMEFPPELKDIATSVYNETGKEISVCALAAEIINRLENPDEDYMKIYRDRSCVIGKKALIRTGNTEILAEIADIDENGFLVVRAEGKSFSVNSGEVIMK